MNIFRSIEKFFECSVLSRISQRFIIKGCQIVYHIWTRFKRKSKNENINFNFYIIHYYNLYFIFNFCALIMIITIINLTKPI
jgi:hypothetical protein